MIIADDIGRVFLWMLSGPHSFIGPKVPRWQTIRHDIVDDANRLGLRTRDVAQGVWEAPNPFDISLDGMGHERIHHLFEHNDS